PTATTLNVSSDLIPRASTERVKEPRAILAVQPGWTWEKLLIRLTEKGTLVAQYGSARGEYRFGRTEGPDGKPKYPALFKMLFQTCVAGRWQHPPCSHKTYAATQRNFARLRELLKKL